jgi:hypothetical protein
MRRWMGLLVVALLLAAGCFGDDDKDPAEPDASPYSGSFVVADTLDYSDCAVEAPLGMIVHVTVAEDAITFAGFAGTWDAQTLRGYGVTAPATVPIDPDEDCYGTYVVTFDIRFSDPDSFTGTYAVANTYTEGCGAPDCAYAYRIGGRRP